MQSPRAPEMPSLSGFDGSMRILDPTVILSQSAARRKSQLRITSTRRQQPVVTGRSKRPTLCRADSRTALRPTRKPGLWRACIPRERGKSVKPRRAASRWRTSWLIGTWGAAGIRPLSSARPGSRKITLYLENKTAPRPVCTLEPLSRERHNERNIRRAGDRDRLW